MCNISTSFMYKKLTMFDSNCLIALIKSEIIPKSAQIQRQP